MSGPYLKKLSKNERYSDAVSLVKVAYMKRLDEEVFGDKARQPETVMPPSRFYDVRPVLLRSSWTAQDGIYIATASFIIDNAGNIDRNHTFPVYSIPGAPEPEGVADATRLFVVWRGRWEIIPTSESVLMPMSLASNWTDQDGIYTATANPIINDEIDASTRVTVYAPTFTDAPSVALRFWAVWRNARWETLQYPLESEGEKYVAGLGIEIGAHSAELGGRPITNVGVRAVRISGSSYEAKGGPLNLASNHFQWRTSSLSGETEAYLKTYRLRVVTDVTNGTPTYKTIEVIGSE